MANDKSFKIKNGLSAKRYLLNSSTLSGSTVDLSLASVFSTTLSSDLAYTFTNPPPSGTATAFSVEVTGGTTTFTNDAFATTLYSGTGAAQTITNGLDLSTDGGLVWIKERTAGGNRHGWYDTVRGVTKELSSNLTNGEGTYTQTLTAFNSDGFDVGTDSTVSDNGRDFVSWTFKKEPSFFDVVTYTGDGVAGREIAHNLGTTVGFMVVKCTSTASTVWAGWHRGLSNSSYYIRLDQAAAENSFSLWDSTAPTSTVFTLGSNGNVNGSGRTYVAYLFAHDTASDSRIQCGSYTGNGSSDGPEINLGWQPQWLLVKNATGVSNWLMVDSMRGFPVGSDNARLFSNLTNAEVAFNGIDPTATGFKLVNSTGGYNTSGNDYIYIAIRASTATDSAITWPSSVKWPSGTAPTTPAAGTKDLFTFLTTDGGTTYYGKKAGSNIA